MKPISNPNILAATIAGASIGGAGGFMVKGQKSEEQGDPASTQLAKSVTNGFAYGVAGAGIGMGIGIGTSGALRKILGK